MSSFPDFSEEASDSVLYAYGRVVARMKGRVITAAEDVTKDELAELLVEVNRMLSKARTALDAMVRS